MLATEQACHVVWNYFFSAYLSHLMCAYRNFGISPTLNECKHNKYDFSVSEIVCELIKLLILVLFKMCFCVYIFICVSIV